MSFRQKGDALLEMIALCGELKEFAYRNNAIVIITNQPDSAFNKPKNYERRPFGDKSIFATKEVFKLENVSNGNGFKSDLVAFRSRNLAKGTRIGSLVIKGGRVSVKT